MLNLDEIRARSEAATGGNWYRAGEREIQSLPGFYPILIARTAQGVRGDADADFITHARQDIPDLLAEVKRLQAERDAAVADIHAIAREHAQGICAFCVYHDKPDPQYKPCKDCHTRVGNKKCFEWRGVQEGGSRDG